MADNQFCGFSGVTIFSADAGTLVLGADGRHGIACNATTCAVYGYSF